MRNNERLKFLSAVVLLTGLLLLPGPLFGHPLDNWNTRTSGVSNLLTGVSYGNSLFVSVGAAGTVLISPDGAAWSPGNSPTQSGLWGVTFGNGKHVAVGDAATIITSSNGASWSQVNPGSSFSFYGVGYGNGTYVAAGANGMVSSSADGTAWSSPSSLGGGTFYGVAHGSDAFVIVGSGGAVFTSPSGTGSWTPQTSGTQATLRGVAFGKSLFVAAGDAGTIHTSPDGVSWTLQTSGTSQNLYGVSFANGIFIATGAAGTVLTSADGTSWIPRNQPLPNATFRDAACFADGDGSFVAVGTNGSAIQSGPVISQGVSYALDPYAAWDYIEARNFIDPAQWQGGLDDGYFDLPLGDFDFLFYGRPVAALRVHTNGYLTFRTDPPQLANAPIPDPGLPNAVVAPFWTDLDLTNLPGLPGEEGVYWDLTGTKPNRRLAVEWFSIPSKEYDSETYWFEVILDESTNRITFQYINVTSGTAYDFGARSAVGIENFTGTLGILYSYFEEALFDDLTIKFTPRKWPQTMDFDQDGVTDVAGYHLPTNQFFLDYAGNLGQFGWGGDDCLPLVWDYDGDGKTGISVYHIPTNQWFVKGLPAENLGQYGFGDDESVPVPGDYDGDGVADRAFYHSPTNRWFIEGRNPIGFGWNGAECVPFAGDIDGDGRDDMILYHIPTNQWFVYGLGAIGQYGWGGDDCLPVPGDYNGDGMIDIAVYHVPTSQWFVLGYPGDNLGQYGWGGEESFPIPGDHNGGGFLARGFYRPAENRWFLEGQTEFVWGWGGADFMPATSQVSVFNWFRFVRGRLQ